MRYIYTFIFTLLLPLVFLKLIYRGLKAPAYWKCWSERLGFFPYRSDGESIWIHAVSVGEVQAAVPFIKAIRESYPGHVIVITTTTPTGRAQVNKALGDSVVVGYLPYDLPWTVSLFLNRIRPKVAIVMETELWPNLFYQCAKKQIPLMIANGRLSARSIKGYQRIQLFVRQTLKHISCIAAQSEADAQGFVTIGAAPERVMATKNIKFDLSSPQYSEKSVEKFRAAFGVHKKLWVAASTHEGEDELVLQAYSQVLKTQPDTVLLLVPRHPERFNTVADLVQRSGFAMARRSSNDVGNSGTQVFVGDTMGELMFFYRVSDVAFVGGSLVPTGGHNILEPAALAVPSIVGPHTFNFKDITQAMLQAGATIQVQSTDELADCVVSILGDEDHKCRMGANAYHVVKQNRGATQLLMGQLDKLIASQNE